MCSYCGNQVCELEPAEHEARRNGRAFYHGSWSHGDDYAIWMIADWDYDEPATKPTAPDNE